MAVDGVNSLGKMEFLNLLTTQLRYQDPLNPVDNTQFIAQLAQFSALEAAGNTNTAITELAGQEAKSRAAGLLGKTVSGVSATTKAAFSGVVQAVDISGATPQLVINNGKYSLNDITGVS